MILGNRDVIVNKARMDLFHSRLILETLSVFLDLFWSLWLISNHKVSLKAVFSPLTSHCYDLTCSTNVRNGVKSACFG
jgi:hypothetical protein